MTKQKELLVEFSVPIQEKAEVQGEFIINGIAISETTTANGHRFLGEELIKSANTLVGVPLLKDHVNSVDNIVGRVNNAHFDSTTRNVPFKAVVKDPEMINKIKQGLINSVSVGAHVDPKNIEENEDGTITPRGIIFKELSLVGIGADPRATFEIALNNALQDYKSHSNEKNHITERGTMTMTENNESNSESTAKTDMSEAILTKLSEVSESQKALTAKVSEMETKLKEADVDEVESSEPEVTAEEPKEESKEESEVTKEEEAEDEDEDSDVEESLNYSIKQGIDGKSFSYERKSYVY